MQLNHHFHLCAVCVAWHPPLIGKVRMRCDLVGFQHFANSAKVVV